MDEQTDNIEIGSTDKVNQTDSIFAYSHNVFIKQMRFEKKGQIYQGHHHEYDHVTLVAKGKAKVTFKAIPEAGIPEEVGVYDSVNMFITRAFREHEIEALEDNTVVCCIHALRTIDGKIYEPDTPREYTWSKNFSLPENTKNTVAFNGRNYLRVFDELIKKADKEGTIRPGSQDDLINVTVDD